MCMDPSAHGPALDLFQIRAGPEHDRISGAFARTRVDQLIRNETLVDLFRQTARNHAARTAIECGGESLSSRELTGGPRSYPTACANSASNPAHWSACTWKDPAPPMWPCSLF